MSVYLVQRLLAEGTLAAPVLVEAMQSALERRSSIIEALVASDVRHAYPIARCFVDDGPRADRAWRPDPRLILDLPPGLCERLLAFPYRERAGAVEVATVTPLERFAEEELTFHLRRPIALFRANLQALLAAAGAPVDLGVLTHSLSEPPPRLETSPIPLVRKSEKSAKSRPRTRTSPGLGDGSSLPPSDPFGSDPFQSSPWQSSVAPLDLLGQARDERELAHALSGLLPDPFLILEIGEVDLTPRIASSTGLASGEPVARWQESALAVAADEGKYMGPWTDNPIHRRFSHLFQGGDLVVAERVGSLHAGLVVVQKVRLDGSDTGESMQHAHSAWERIVERTTLFR